LLFDFLAIRGQVRERDGRGRRLPVWQECRAVAADELFVMNWQSEKSLDG
jgi:type IV secretory pathway protease TraF